MITSATLPKGLALAGIKDMEAANLYIKEVYLPAFNAEFMQPAMEEELAFVAYISADLDDILCEQHERVVGKDNCVSFEGLKLQIPPDQYRLHYVKFTVRVYRYPDGQYGGLSWSTQAGLLRAAGRSQKEIKSVEERIATLVVS